VTWIGAVLLLLALALLAGFVGNLVSLHSSDPAGNGLAYSFAILLGIAVWLLLAALLLIAGLRGEMPGWGVACAFLLHPLSGAAAIATVEWMRQRPGSASGWPAALPALAALLLVAWSLWAYLPAIRASVSPTTAGLVVWGGIVLISAVTWPSFAASRKTGASNRAAVQAAYEAEQARQDEEQRRENLAQFEALGPDTPLWRWLEFTTDGNELRERAFESIRGLARRQSDAEEMIARGFDLPVLELHHLGLAPTEALGAALRKHLLDDAEHFRTQAANGVPYENSAQRIERHLPALRWMAANGLDVRPPAEAYATAARAFAASDERDRFLRKLAEVGR
jgi:hypothetical protein